MDKIIWQTKEYEYREKTNDWFWAVGVIALSAIIISIIYGNYVFAIFMAIATATLLMYSVKKPETLEIEINNKGIRIQKELHPYKTIKSFWVDSLSREKKLILSTDRIIMPIMALSIEESSPEEIRLLLLRHIKEEEIHEPVSQRLWSTWDFNLS